MKNTLAQEQAACLCALYFAGGLTMLGEWNAAGHSVWLALLIAALLSLPLLFAYSRIADLLTGSTFFALSFLALAACLAAFFIHRATLFLTACLLPDVSVFVTGGLLLLFCILLGMGGLTPLGRFSKLLLPFLALLFLLLCLIVFASWDAFQVESLFDLKPRSAAKAQGFAPAAGPLLTGIAFFSVVFLTKGILLIHIFRLAGGSQLSPFQAVRKGILFCTPSIAALCFLSLFALGSAAFDLLRYPVYFSFILIEAGEYVHHFELLFITFYVFCELTAISVFFAAIRILAGKILAQVQSGKKKSYFFKNTY